MEICDTFKDFKDARMLVSLSLLLALVEDEQIMENVS